MNSFNVILRSENKLTGSNADAIYDINWCKGLPSVKANKYKLTSSFLSTDYDNNDDIYVGGVRYNKNCGLVHINMNPNSSQVDTDGSSGCIIGIAKRDYNVTSNTSISHYEYNKEDSLPIIVDGGNFPSLLNVKLQPLGTQLGNLTLLHSSNVARTGNDADFMSRYILTLHLDQV